MGHDVLGRFHPAVREWFSGAFAAPTAAQAKAWPHILAGESTLLLAPTGSGKTLAAFLAAIERLMFSEPTGIAGTGCRVVYVSPLKALAVDVERNLRAPLAGIAAVAERRGERARIPTIAVRSGDTPQNERAKIARRPPDILITTPESLYLVLTSRAASTLASVETVIVDEIHSVVSTKRGAHLFLSLERLEEARTGNRPLQRIGLSATQRPLDEVARLLGGGETDVADESAWRPRAVRVVDAGRKRALELRVEVPVEDMASLGRGEGAPAPGATPSIWPAIHPRLVELVRRHRSTMIFVNSRRLAEKLAGDLNEHAGEEIVLAHHGSVAREQRLTIEERLKAGSLPGIVATSTLELGLDLGAVDLVVQIEAPPSVAAGMQRVGRSGHQVEGVSSGVVFPKYRGDLLACAAVAERMHAGDVEATYYPRSPLDVLAQQMVAMVAVRPHHEDELYSIVRRAAPFAELPRSAFHGVLDMLAGRYPSDDFAGLRPRVVWDRVTGSVKARPGAQRIAVVNGGTIPDRGLYGVFLEGDGDKKRSRRVGELDEEMVFETREGELFVLGASTWRVEEITHDRVVVTPAPGQLGKMPFWHGDRPGRPVELGRAIGALARTLAKAPAEQARKTLVESHALDVGAADNLVRYLEEQRAATGEVPSDRTIVVERFVDEIGDWRVCVLSPFGAKLHAPWASVVTARLRERYAGDVETLWSDDGMAFRLPETSEPPDVDLFFPDPEEIEDLVIKTVSGTSMFASRFREAAGRALLLPKKSPHRRQALWAQRKRAQELLQVATRYPSFPIVLETYRECLKDVFDLAGLKDLLGSIQSRKVRVVTVSSQRPSPFASSLLFAWVGSFVYDGDAPLAERRAQLLAIDNAQLRELLGEAELRDILDPEAIASVEASLQRTDGTRPARNADEVHDLLLGLGDLSVAEIAARAIAGAQVRTWLTSLERERRALPAQVGAERRWIACEDAARYRDAVGVVPPPGLPASFLEPVAEPVLDLVSRFARTHGPFRAETLGNRLGLAVGPVRLALARLVEMGKVVEGELLPGERRGREHCDVGVLRAIKRRSLAKLRSEVEPVDQATFVRFLLEWHGVGRPQRGAAALSAVIGQLQGAPLVASSLESEILPARLSDFAPPALDALTSSGSVIWRAIEPIGGSDGRIALYLADHYPVLAPPSGRANGEVAAKVRAVLEARGASFFTSIHREVGGFVGDVAEGLWELVWAGEVTNDSLAPLRSYVRSELETNRWRESAQGAVRWSSPGVAPRGTEGRWWLLPRTQEGQDAPTQTARRAALAKQLLERHGVMTREAVGAEGIEGGFTTVYDVLKAMEERGQARRGYFVAGLGATQFARPGAEDRLRAMRDASEEDATVIVAATDPGNPFGGILPWPEHPTGHKPRRVGGATVVIHRGEMIAWLPKHEQEMWTYLPKEEPERSRSAKALARAIGLRMRSRRGSQAIDRIDAEEAIRSPIAGVLRDSGFVPSGFGSLRVGTGHEVARSVPRTS